MSLPYASEQQFAVAAVRRACQLTSQVFNKLVKNETLTKDDKSPVTVGDFSAQALVNTMLSRAFPDDPIVGEETADELREDTEAAHAFKKRITELANEALTAELGLGDNPAWGIGPNEVRTTNELLDAIDRGNHNGGRTGRLWTLDPIDGTKGFLRGEQYAVCLALIVDSRVVLGVIGCPNLPVDVTNLEKGRGCIFSAVRGGGTQQLTLSGADPHPVSIPFYDPVTLNLLESVEAAHASHSINDRVASLLNITRAPTRMDSQAKYGALVRGDGGVYLRMPTGARYKEKIWDHASGNILVEEAGGVVTDSRGQPLDFGLGRTLGENYGIIAAGKEAHAKVLEAVQKVLAEQKAPSN